MRTERGTRKSWPAAACALGVTLALPFLAQASSGQSTSNEWARVPTSHANAHGAPGSGSALLVMVPKDTVLPVVGRRGEWVEVQLSPELRETGIVVRWYEGEREIIRRGQKITIGDETTGWMHDSTVEITDVAPDE